MSKRLAFGWPPGPRYCRSEVFPDEFLTREQFDALDEHEQGVYMVRLTTAMRPIFAGTAEIDDETRLQYVTHYLDFAGWVLPPEVYERLVQGELWDAIVEDAETMRAIFARHVASGDLTDEERAEGEGRLRALQAIIEHKRDLEDLP